MDITAKSRYREEIEQKVRHLYSYKNQLTAFDKDILADPLEKRLKDKTHALENWYEESRVLIQDCIRDYNAITSKGLRDIQNFFPRRK
jgi:t-SNARE complex subunit (syntaxin)